MSITLDDLFTLFEEVEKSDLLLQEKKSNERVLNLPRLHINENFGKLKTVEREELQRIVRTATAGKNSAYDRLHVMQRQMSELRAGTLGKIKNPRRILSQIMLLETFNRLFKSFQPAPAGFVNEGLLSVFYGTSQIPAGEGNAALQIGDILESDGTPVSLKTKTKDHAIVDGSIKNLYVSLNNSPTSKVYFDIFMKEVTGGDEDSHVGSLTFLRFHVDSQNINQFLNMNLFEIDPEDEKKVKLRPQFANDPLANIGQPDQDDDEEVVKEEISLQEANLRNISTVLKSLVDNPEDYQQVDISKISDLLDPILSSGKNPLITNDTDEAKKMAVYRIYVAKLIKDLEQVIADLKTKAETEEEKQKLSQIEKLDSSLTRFYLSELSGKAEPKYRKMKSGKEKLPNRFELDNSQWMKFVKTQGGFEKQLVLQFSDKEINQGMELAIEQIDDSITDLFNLLGSFTSNLQEYLTSINSNRTSKGVTALEEATKLPNATNKVVETVGKNPSDDET